MGNGDQCMSTNVEKREQIRAVKATIFDMILTRDEYLAKAKYTSDEINRLMVKLKEMEQHGSNESTGISPV